MARFGNQYLAAYGLGTRLDFVLFSLGFGVAAAGLTLVGMATGAGRHDLVPRYVAQSHAGRRRRWSPIPAVLVTVRPSLWIGLFTAAPDIHAVGARYFAFVGPSYLFVIASMVVATAFQGARPRHRAADGDGGPRRARGQPPSLALAGSADTIFAIIATGNVCGCLALVALFRAALR